MSKAKHGSSNQVRITVLEQLRSRLPLDSPHAKQHFHSQGYIWGTNFQDNALLKAIDPNGLTLGDKHPGPDLRHYLSTYNKETNEQTNNIF